MAFAEYRSRSLLGLGHDAVEGLLAQGVKIELQPDAAGFLAKDDEAVGGWGYCLDEGDHPNRWDVETPIELPGVRVFRVAGPRFHSAALQDPCFEPPARVRLLPEPQNRFDRNAIAVYDDALQLRVGYVPRRAAAEIGRALNAGRVGTALSLWQWLDLTDGRRTGLHILVAGSKNVEFFGTVPPDDGEIPF